jgi:tetratricopeptide (TPR) repeat protein
MQVMLSAVKLSEAFALPVQQTKHVLVGREQAIQAFDERILQAAEPLTSSMVIWGEDGIGKSTLLRYLYDRTRGARDTGRIVVAYSDTQMTSPLAILACWAAQLRCQGLPLPLFEERLALYRQTTRPWNAELEIARIALTHEPSHGKGVYIQGKPLLRSFYEGMVEEASQTQQEALPTDEAMLIQTFVEDLQWQVKALAASSAKSTPSLRILLFCDAEGAGAARSIERLLPLLFQQPASIPLSLVVALQEWSAHLSAFKTKNLYVLRLPRLTEQEARTYLEAQENVDTTDYTLWYERSAGIPLFLRLSLLLPKQQLESLAAPETLLLRWLTGLGDVARQAVLQAALFSYPFTQHDLAAFYPQAQQQIAVYRWLTSLPFVQYSLQDGRHMYHRWVQEQLCHYFLQSAPQQYVVARRALAHYYRRKWQHAQKQEDQQVQASARGHEYGAAFLVQLLALPDEESHLEAVKLMLHTQHILQQDDALDALLYAIGQNMHCFRGNARSFRVVSGLQAYGRDDLTDPTWVAATEPLFTLVERGASFPPALQAYMYCRRGAVFMANGDLARAIAEVEKALTIDPACSEAYLLRGMMDTARQAYQQAVEAFNQVLLREKTSSLAYIHRGFAYWKLKAYEQAIDDLDHAYLLTQQAEEVAALRSQVYGEMEMKGRGLIGLDAIAAMKTGDVLPDLLQAMAFYVLGDDQRALGALNTVLALHPTHAQAYALRGYVYLTLGEVARADEDWQRSQELDPHDGYLVFLRAWLALVQHVSVDDKLYASLEEIATSSEDIAVAALCRGLIALLHEQYEQACAEFERAMTLRPGQSDAAFWKGLACALLARDDEAAAAFQQVRTAEMPLPKVLLKPLRRLEQKDPDRYRKYAEQLYGEALLQ